jgi:peptidoglycan/xylan/chitin deacetylase (PgdA/CDA1 family)
MLSIILWIIIGFLALAALLFFMGRHTFWLPYRAPRLPRILMLHQVDPSLPPSGMNMPPERFEVLIRLLQKKKLRFLTVSELVKRHAEQPSVALTFDDGYADNYLYAFPLLKKYNVKATIYLTPDIEGMVKLTDAQIKEMADSGLVEFGAHTLTHINLLKSTDEVALAEIEGSRTRIASLLGECNSFAYPFGRFDQHHQDMVRDSGFSSAVSTRKRIEPISNANIFNLPRISTNGTMSVFQMKIALAKGRFRL